MLSSSGRERFRDIYDHRNFISCPVIIPGAQQPFRVVSAPQYVIISHYIIIFEDEVYFVQKLPEAQKPMTLS